MGTPLRIATFNLENLDNTNLAGRISALQPQLLRLHADVLCLQEVNPQKDANGKYNLSALNSLIKGTPYEKFNRAVTKEKGDYLNKQNLVILSRFPIISDESILNKFVKKPLYRKVTSDPPENSANDVTFERPILYAIIDLGNGNKLHVITAHLKSKIPVSIKGQQIPKPNHPNVECWKTASGWAEGFFLSSLKRVGQALEIRMLIDNIFDNNKMPAIAVCGDFNSDDDDVPVSTIRGMTEETDNPDLRDRVMVPCEFSVPEPSRFSLLYHGERQMIDHIIVSRPLLAHYHGTWVYNEDLSDETIAYRYEDEYPESDHAPVVAEFMIG